MRINATIELTSGEELTQTPEAAAIAILAALNGDPQNDTCTVTVSIPAAVVGADTPPPTPPEALQ